MDEGIWEIRAGNYITLGELFKFGASQATCFHLYRMYLDFDFYIHRQGHSKSREPNAIYNQNAKNLRYRETGKYALPRHNESWWW